MGVYSIFTGEEIIEPKTERDRIIRWLFEKRVMRESMLGGGWYVIYTEDGAIDVKLDEIPKGDVVA